MRKVLFGITVSCLCIVNLLLIQDVNPEKSEFVTVSVKQLKSPEIRNRLSARDALLKELKNAAKDTTLGEYTEIINELIAIAAEKREEYIVHDPKELAIEVLGEIGSIEAIPIFVEQVDFTYPSMRYILDASLLNPYPCARALEKMDSLAVQGIFDYLGRAKSEELSEKRLDLYAWIIIETKGSKDLAKQVVLEEIKKASGKKRKELKRLLTHFEKKKQD